MINRDELINTMNKRVDQFRKDFFKLAEEHMTELSDQGSITFYCKMLHDEKMVEFTKEDIAYFVSEFKSLGYEVKTGGWFRKYIKVSW